MHEGDTEYYERKQRESDALDAAHGEGYRQGDHDGYERGRRAAFDELLAALEAIEQDMVTEYGFWRDVTALMEDYRARYPQPAAAESEGDHAER